MKSVAGGIILAIILFVAGAALWDEAKTTRRLAQAHERLSTLHYDAEDELDEGWQLLNRLPVNVGNTAADVARHRATVSYWLGRYQALTDMISGRTSTPLDAHLLFMAANAAFREVATQPLDKKAAIERLDTVVQSYTEVLRRDPGYEDAAFNYELVTRMRDAIAKAPAGRPRPIKAPAAPSDASVDLPAGVTIHGRPGGPPEGTDMSDFKTITPMRYDEREEQMDPGRGQQIRRKG